MHGETVKVLIIYMSWG